MACFSSEAFLDTFVNFTALEQQLIAKYNNFYNKKRKGLNM